MTVGDIIHVVELSTGMVEEAQIISSSPQGELFNDDHGHAWWANGEQITPYLSPHQTAPKTHTCEVIKTAEQVRREYYDKRILEAAKVIHEGVLSGSYSVNDVAEAIKHWRNS